jgi:hypothetical protein
VRTLYVAFDHGSILDVWRQQDSRSLSLLRLDDHCDLRGMLVDRRAQLATPTRDRRLRARQADGGNFVAVAVLEGRVKSVRWLASEWGGRQHDVGTVSYTTDASALPYRLGLLAGDWRPFRYEVLDPQGSVRLAPGEHLDIDWDYFASRLAPRTSVKQRAARFLDADLGQLPPAIYLAYSASYSHATRGLFDEFSERLARRFDARIERLPDWEAPPRRPPPTALRRLGFAAQRALRRVGVY